MSATSPIDDLREAYEKSRRDPDEPLPGPLVLSAIDRVLASDISIGWMDNGVWRTNLGHGGRLAKVGSKAPVEEDTSAAQPPALAVQCHHLRERVAGVEEAQRFFASLDLCARLEGRILELEQRLKNRPSGPSEPGQ